MDTVYKCNSCNNSFDHPEIKKPDAGFTVGILGMKNINSIRFCPVCLSTKIEEGRYAYGTDTAGNE